MTEELLDICPSCGKRHGKKELLNKIVSAEELNSLTLIQNKYSCACQAAQPNAIPDGTPKDKAEMFIAGALAAKAEAQWLQQMWWNEILAKYAIADKGNINIDFSTRELFLYTEVSGHQ